MADSVCPGCGVLLPEDGSPFDSGYNASGECLSVLYELSAYTLGHGDSAFLHQHVVDAYAAQHHGEGTARIRIAFALIGLFLTFERGRTGREVQRAHMKLGKVKREWPRFEAPEGRAVLTVVDVMAADAGPARDDVLMRWARGVWMCWSDSHEWARLTCESLLSS